MITDPQGNPLARRELLRRIGRLEQVAGIEPFAFDDGPSRGVRALRFRTGGGSPSTCFPTAVWTWASPSRRARRWPGSPRTASSPRPSTNQEGEGWLKLSPGVSSSPAA